MAEPDIDKGIYAKLTGTAAVTGLVGPAVYYGQAPATTAMPYIVFLPAGGGEDNTTQRRTKTVVYMIEGVAATKAAALAIDSAVSGALHEQRITLDADGWSNYALNRESDYRPPVENVEGRQVWRVGAYYRVRVSADTV